MRVEVRRGRNGKPRSCWYGVYKYGGKKRTINLGVKVKGLVPEISSEQGDLEFEKTRVQAQEKLKTIIDELKSRKSSDYILEKIYEQKTGNEVPSVLLDNLAETWLALPRRDQLSQKYIVCQKALLNKFTQFVRNTDKDVKTLEEVNQRQVIDFLKAEEARGVSAKTYNDTLKFLKSAWSNLLPGFPNPLLALPTKSLDTKFRKPFTEEQLSDILDSAQEDPFIYPIIVTGMCTAMRRGDC